MSQRFPRPVKQGEIYQVKITELGAKGDGVCRISNFVVFVPGAKPGQELKIRIRSVFRKFAIAEPVQE